MPLSLRPMAATDIPAVCDFLKSNMNQKFSVSRWRKLFSHGWWKHAPCSQPDLGIVAEDAGRIVGVHGHVCADRMIDGRRERFLNFTSWYILKEYREQGIGSRMLEMATSDPEATCTVFSLSPKRIEFFKTLGMNVLEDERVLWRKQGRAYTNLDMFTDMDGIDHQVSPAEMQVIKDHRNLHVMPVLAVSCCDQCLLLISQAVKGEGVTYYDVLYRSNPKFFSDHAVDIAEAFLPDGNAVLAADRRFVASPSGGEIEVIKSPRFYKSSRIPREEIDLAYSEIPLLDLKLD